MHPNCITLNNTTRVSESLEKLKTNLQQNCAALAAFKYAAKNVIRIFEKCKKSLKLIWHVLIQSV
jgi:hypothetical protein